MAQILLSAHGTEGDIVPFIRMGQALLKRGHGITLLTHCHFERAVHQAGLGFGALDSPEDFESFVSDVPLLNALPTISTFFQRHVLPRLRQEYELLCERGRGPETVIVSRATPGIAARLAAEVLGVPHLTVFMTPMHIATWPVIEDAIGHVLGLEINRVRAEIGLSAIKNWQEWWRSPHQGLGLWPEWFSAPDPTWSVDVKLVGFLALYGSASGDLSPTLQEFLDQGEPPILITRATSVAEDADFFAVSLEACQRLGRRALLVTPHRQWIPEPLPVGAQWFDYAPFIKLLPRVAAVIHHGGLGTLSQALAAGIPQLALTDSSERNDNAAHLLPLNVGEGLRRPRWRPAQVADGLHRLLTAPNIQEQCRAIARRIAATDSAQAAAEIIESLFSTSPEPQKPIPSLAISIASESADEMALKSNPLLEEIEKISPERRAFLALRIKQQRTRNL